MTSQNICINTVENKSGLKKFENICALLFILYGSNFLSKNKLSNFTQFSISFNNSPTSGLMTFDIFLLAALKEFLSKINIFRKINSNFWGRVNFSKFFSQILIWGNQSLNDYCTRKFQSNVEQSHPIFSHLFYIKFQDPKNPIYCFYAIFVNLKSFILQEKKSLSSWSKRVSGSENPQIYVEKEFLMFLHLLYWFSG